MNPYYQSVFANENGNQGQSAPEGTQVPTGPVQPPMQIRIQQPQPAPGEPSSAVDIYSYPQNLRDALQLIVNAIEREAEDNAIYEYLTANVPAKDEALLKRMWGEDKQNFINLRRIYTALTGQPPPEPSPLTRLPLRGIKSFCDALEKGLRDLEQETMEYPRILYALQSRTNINMMLNIIFTEIRHYIQTSLMYFENKCEDRAGSSPN